MTYRQLLDAIRVAHKLEEDVDKAANNPKRWGGTAEQRDNAEAELNSANHALDEEVRF